MTPELIVKALETLRQQKPLVVSITNYVVMNNTANALLALGASPIMAHSREEMAEMMTFAGALVINIGTLDQTWVERMAFAIKHANANQIPVVLDPVGCGATTFRTDTARQFAKLAEQLIIRGNASEIIALAGHISQAKGVDSQDSSDAALAAANALVQEYQANVVISGATDYSVSAASTFALDNGHAMMPLVTGTGCSLSALTGAFAAIGETSGLAAAAVLGIAGEMAGEHARGPGNLQMALLDSLYNLDGDTVLQRLKLRQHP
ncbi:hydroxyethylthiazole kinase [Marinomonas ostreistagni]|uniref:hydroxyethylthiazole kinase n=1 Tax=Marinomonas ostreistagni TaxID=359209 RepID=UPI00194FB60E|nr:hydroxyethylthiazole kinase [Marinomonas ostreistagni]MBM6551871.1 hydroxyethylthiazole kinase [Marinomonas ostreistagni]